MSKSVCSTPAVLFFSEKKDLHFHLEGADDYDWINQVFSLNSSSGEIALQTGGFNIWRKKIQNRKKKKGNVYSLIWKKYATQI